MQINAPSVASRSNLADIRTSVSGYLPLGKAIQTLLAASDALFASGIFYLRMSSMVPMFIFTGLVSENNSSNGIIYFYIGSLAI